jgi:hypothetical protein
MADIEQLLNEGEERILIRQVGAEAIILYPSLGSPAIVSSDRVLKLIILAKESEESDYIVDLFKLHVAEVNSDEKFKAIREVTAFKLHAHLRLFDWGGADAFYRYTEECIHNYIDLVCTLLSVRHDIYKYAFPNRSAINRISRMHGATYAFNEEKCYKGWYLGNLEERKGKEFYLETMLPDGSGPEPFGILNSQVTDTYLAAGYKYLFQLHVGGLEKINYPSDGMMEIMWLYFDRARIGGVAPDPSNAIISEIERLRNSWQGETDKMPLYLINKIEALINQLGIYYRDLHCELINEKLKELFEKDRAESLIPGLSCTWHGRERDDKIPSFFAPQFGKFDFARDIPLENVPGELERLPVMDLTEEKITPSNGKPPQLPEPYTMIRPRHPVYFVQQKPRQPQVELLRTGVLADPHLSTRQSLYRLVKAQVIPNIHPNSTQPPTLNSDTPFIGPMAHEALQSSYQLLMALGMDSNVDMVALVGDLYDHLRNIDPRECADQINKTSDLWYLTDYRQRAKEDLEKYYPKYLDTLLGLHAIYEFYYDHKKPLFYINGNHEGYKNPFPISPPSYRG